MSGVVVRDASSETWREAQERRARESRPTFWCLWCAPETPCPIHRAHPEFKPEELEAKAGHFEVTPAWIVAKCKECDGTGEVDHHCSCPKCTADTEDCDTCDGTRKVSTCSICGFQCSIGHFKREHERECWPEPVVLTPRTAA